MARDCRCGHPFGSGPCLSVHAVRAAAMAPVPGPAAHVHQWQQPVRGVVHCASPTCHTITLEDQDALAELLGRLRDAGADTSHLVTR